MSLTLFDRASAKTRLLLVATAVPLLLMLMLASGCYFIVGPSERAYVVRLGQVTTTVPFGSGFYLKWPVIDHIDHLKVAKDTIQTPDTTFFTKDTQSVTMALGVTFDVPDAAVYNLLYQTGAAGNRDFDSNIIKIVLDRVRSVVSKYSISDVAGPEREQVMALKGKADAAAIAAKIEAAGGSDPYVRQLQAEAMQNWKGDVPQMTLGSGGMSSVVPIMQIPVPPPK
jgi:regulator of protease activity HflC (stomatin/prohibitin superfamily)